MPRNRLFADIKTWASHRPYAQAKVLSRESIRAFLSDLSPSLAGAKRVLIVGAGGQLEDAVRRILPPDVTVVTIDVDEARVPDIVMSVENLPTAGMEKFDAVFALEVLEHVQNLDGAVAGMKSILARGGHLILSVPWIAPLHDLPHDYRRLTPQALIRVLEGLDIEVLEGHGTAIQSIRYLALRGVYSRSRADRIVAFGLGMAPRPRAARRFVLAQSQGSTDAETCQTWPKSVIGWRLAARSL